MADFTQIIQEINADINTNGVGAITGAKLNEVLRDMIAAVNAEKQDPLTIDATPTEGSTNPVQSGGVYDILVTMFSNGCLYGGIVGPNDQPTYSGDHRYFYLAKTEGIYTHFNNRVVSDEVALFYWSDIANNWVMSTLWPNDGQLADMFSVKADKVVYVDASTPPSTMDANKVYRYGTLSGDTTFPAFTAVSSDDTEVKIWCWTFTTPSTAPTITWPAGITAWNGGSAPTINASKNYEVSVMDGIATIIES